MRFKVRLGLHARFVLLMSVLVVAFGGVLTTLAVRIQHDGLRHELVERGKLLTSLVGANAEDALALLDVMELRGLLADARTQENVVDALAFDDEYRVLTDGTVDNIRRHEVLPASLQEPMAAGDAMLVELGEGLVTIAQPVRLGEQLLGGVLLRFSMSSLAREKAALTVRTILVGLAFVIVAALTSVGLIGSVTRPLGMLIAGTEAVARGDAPPRILVRSRHEVGALATAFNQMADRLRETTISRDYLDQVVSSMGESLLVLSAEGAIERVNRATCLLLGWREKDLIGRSLEAVLARQGESGNNPLLEALGTPSGSHGVETEFVGRSGETIPVIASLTVMRYGDANLHGFVCVARDIRARKRIERMKDEFISVVNHELRTPLTAIRGSISLLLGGTAGPLSERATELLEIGQRNSSRLERLIHDLLDSQQLEAGRMDVDLQDVRLMSLVDQAIEANEAYGAQFAVRFVREGDIGEALVRVDADRLIQVLTNLLSNASRFSPRGETVTVAVSRRLESLRVAVTDKGPGIPVEYRDRLFEKFVQAHADVERRRGGTGLGLSIAKAIVERLGGTIGFETEIGAGTTFFVDLPEVDAEGRRP